MRIEASRIAALLSRPALAAQPLELRREGPVFLIGFALPAQPTLETVFDSDCQTPVELLVFDLPDAAALTAATELIALLKKNLRGFVLASLGFRPLRRQLEAAYACGVDLLDIPLDPTADWTGAAVREQLDALAQAREIFPRWAVAATLGWAVAPYVMQEAVDELLRNHLVPLVSLDARCPSLQGESVAPVYAHLVEGWRRAGVSLRPWMPLIELTTPLLQRAPRTFVGNLLGRARDARLRAGSDLRRLLRVREVEQSFDSAGL
ncbi:hypothetical protein [Geoalkalibacter sp.]|uniref:hypothetical protein n=1 Tax=Geoalkalibacter sp. TaxID=3041440 RepID=UPI00272DFF89|nr:hypothetical protein [Geoalkalibacter sp.]